MPRSLMQVVPFVVVCLVAAGCANAPGLRSASQPTPPVQVDYELTTVQVASDTTPAPLTQAPRDDVVAMKDSESEERTAIFGTGEFRLAREEDLPPNPRFLLAQRSESPSASAAESLEEEYDPWEPINEKMFEFNRRLDRYILKPVAKAYNTVVPDRVQVMISNGFDNITFVPRMMNSLFQGKFDGAVREFGRFIFNSTIGIGGLFDVAKMEGIEKSREDFGQTLGFYGVGPGPYVIVPFMEPLTVRDGIGKAVDGAMDPMSYFVPFFYTRLLLKIEETVNDRSLNLELFQGFEESVIDMYSAVRHGYLKRREKLIRE